MSAALEVLLLAALLLWSSAVVLGRLLPGLKQALRARLAATCQRRGWVDLATRLQAPAAAGCASGCARCGGCDSAQPLQLRPRKPL